MGWIILTAVDLYICLVVIEALKPTLPVEKLGRAKYVSKVLVVLIILLAIALLVVLARRWRMHA